MFFSENGQRVGFFARAASGRPDFERLEIGCLYLPGQKRQDLGCQSSENPAITTKARDRDSAEAVEHRPFFRVTCQKLSILLEIAEAKLV